MIDQLRSSQIITTYGPGAMVDFPDESVIIAGLEHWVYDNASIPYVEEPRLVEHLAQLLEKPGLHLRQPPPMNNDFTGRHIGVAAWQFPEWFLVQKTEKSRQGFPRRRLIHRNILHGKKKYTSDDKQKYSIVPIRFVQACVRGHVEDIDWKTFVHEKHSSTCICDLWVEERGTSGDLDEIMIVCDCGAERAMSQAARMELKALGHCNGSRPWLGAGTREQCGNPNKLLIRSASNAYFPQQMSVISIPDARGQIFDAVGKLWEDFLCDVETMEDLLSYRERKRKVEVGLSGFSAAHVFAVIQEMKKGTTEDTRKVKQVEFDALTEAAEELGSDTPDGDFYARRLPRSEWDDEWMRGIRDIVLVHRLREVIALVGFTRFEAAGTDIDGELQLDVQRAPLSIDEDWLPAVENRGEGIFIQFDSAAIQAWKEQQQVRERMTRLMEGFNKWTKEHQSQREFPGTAYYLLHSLSHLLITSISLECGYPASSLKERIYASRDQYGILIYTGSPGSEGTLGGLVEAGRSIKRHFWKALEMGALCSNDPVCAMREPGRNSQQPLSGCACHGCLLVSETSCEQRNDFLDRALVVPTVESKGTEFFPPVGL